MRILLIACILLVTNLSIAQSTIGETIESYCDENDLSAKKLLKLEAFRLSDEFKESKGIEKWQKLYRSWDKEGVTTDLNIAQLLMNQDIYLTDREQYREEQSGFSHAFLLRITSYFEDINHFENDISGPFIRTILEAQLDTSYQAIELEMPYVIDKLRFLGNNLNLSVDDCEKLATYDWGKDRSESIQGLSKFLNICDEASMVKFEVFLQENNLYPNKVVLPRAIAEKKHFRTYAGMKLYSGSFSQFKLNLFIDEGVEKPSSDWLDSTQMILFQGFLGNDTLYKALVSNFIMRAYKKYEIATFTKEHKEQDGRLWWHQLNHLENEMLKAITLRFHPRNGAVDNNVEAVLTLAANKVFVLPSYPESLYQDMHYGSREKPVVLTDFEREVIDGVSENGLSSELNQLILDDSNVLIRLNSSQEFRFALYKKCLLIACNSKRNYLDENFDPSILTKKEEPKEPKSDNTVELKQEKLKKIIARISNIVHSRRNTYDIFKSYRVQFDGINSLESYPKIPSFKETEIMNLLREYCSGDSLEMRHFVFYIPPARSPDILGADEKTTLLSPRRPMPQVEIIDFPDVEASFPGGVTAMTDFIRETLIYPKRAIRNKIEGTVQLSFVVETDGSFTNIRVVRGVSDELDSEAKRIIEAMPKWGSAESHGKKIRKKFELKIVFELD